MTRRYTHRADSVSVLTTADVARALGCSRFTAWRLLRSLHRRHGDEAVRICSGRYETTVDALAKYAPKRPLAVDRIDRRFEAVEARLDETERRAGAQACELADLRRQFAGSRCTA